MWFLLSQFRSHCWFIIHVLFCFPFQKQKIADLQNLILRNQLLLKSGKTPSQGFYLPFILVQVYLLCSFLKSYTIFPLFMLLFHNLHETKLGVFFFFPLKHMWWYFTFRMNSHRGVGIDSLIIISVYAILWIFFMSVLYFLWILFIFLQSGTSFC